MDEKRRAELDGEIFPSNSITRKTEVKETIEKKKIKPIVKGKVIKQKRSFGKRIKEVIFGDDTRSVGSYVVYDVLVPAAKAMVTDIVGGGIEMLVYGERQGRNTRRRAGSSYVSYDKVSYRGDDRDRRDRRDISHTARARHDFDDVILETRGEAEDVLSHLVDLTIDYGQASVADFYDLVGITASFTDNKWGWTDLRDASVTRQRGGYLINFPRTKQID